MNEGLPAKPKYEILPAADVKELALCYKEARFKKLIKSCRDKTAEAIYTAYIHGHSKTTININSSDPTIIKVWIQMGAELADLNYLHTYYWNTTCNPRCLESMTVEWGEW